MNKTKPVENWEENFREKFFEQFHGYEAKNSEGSIIWRYDTDNPWELLSFIMMFFRNLLQEQAEHFVKLGEGLKNKHTWKGMRPQTFNNIKSVGYQEAISDFQEAIKNDKK